MVERKGLYKFYYALLWLWCAIFYRVRAKGRENVFEGPCIICGNHTSMADPLIVAVKMKNSRGYNYTKFMAKAELGRVSILRKIAGHLIVFVERGKSDLGAVKESIAHLKDGGNMVIFPEGRRVDAGEESDAKTGVILMALKSGAKLLPVYISEKRKPPLFFGRVDVVFGEPYSIERDRSVPTSEFYHIAVADLMERIRKLGEQVKR